MSPIWSARRGPTRPSASASAWLIEVRTIPTATDVTSARFTTERSVAMLTHARAGVMDRFATVEVIMQEIESAYAASPPRSRRLLSVARSASTERRTLRRRSGAATA